MTAESIKSSTDGRHRRSAESRDRIVTAMLDLVEAGAVTPSAEDVAARARVGLRSVFRHFKDMESLRGEMLARLAKNYAWWLVPYTATDWRGQLTEAVDRRLTTYEGLMPFKRAADVHRHESPAVQLEYISAIAMMRGRLQSTLPPEAVNDPVAFEALDLWLSFEAWQRLRNEQKLSSDDARRVVEAAVEAILAYMLERAKS